MVFAEGDLLGYAVTTALYAIVYMALCAAFRAFKGIEYRIMETFLSQVLSLAIAGVLLYLEICTVGRGFLPILPGFLALAAQTLYALAWAVALKRTSLRLIRPERLLLLAGDRKGIGAFLKKLKKRRSAYAVARVMDIDAVPRDRDTLFAAYDGVIFYETTPEQRMTMLLRLIEMRKAIFLTPGLQEITLEGFGARHIVDTPLLKYEYRAERFWYNLVKRVMDLAVSAVLLAVLSPLMALTAVLIHAEDGGPVLFRQKRVTKGGKVFTILKFRSMVVDAEKHGAQPYVDGDPRVTKIGRLIRRIRFDESPQLWNVLRGEMTLVGPRPERVEHVEKYTAELPEFSQRLRVKGGLTGYAQIYGKYNTTAYDKLRLDLLYIERQSLRLDLQLLLLTLKVLFAADSTEGFHGPEEEAARRDGGTRAKKE